MLVLVCYDVAITTKGGQKRLRHVSRACQDYGQRVQNSVFECNVTPAQYVVLQNRLASIINHEIDNIRFYLLGKNYQKRIETMGVQKSFDLEKDTIIF
ncbi:MAG: CRISPR-associated endonuclease Cas2 [Fastidiosipilaceae bacterium]|jgi:CRISPR-associated protein Cas2|nr:CRISPR-associated endonuclease Cas2 [Clostridiaceae bacterium]